MGKTYVSARGSKSNELKFLSWTNFSVDRRSVASSGGLPHDTNSAHIECIAEYTGRPLLSLTCGDIGISEQAVDKNLRKWFTIGEKWGALILVDEADVYLESRQPGDVKRNGLVSGKST